jgi:hypothetical protein
MEIQVYFYKLMNVLIHVAINELDNSQDIQIPHGFSLFL